jgi:hypothetical protein
MPGLVGRVPLAGVTLRLGVLAVTGAPPFALLRRVSVSLQFN